MKRAVTAVKIPTALGERFVGLSRKGQIMMPDDHDVLMAMHRLSGEPDHTEPCTGFVMRYRSACEGRSAGFNLWLGGAFWDKLEEARKLREQRRSNFGQNVRRLEARFWALLSERAEAKIRERFPFVAVVQVSPWVSPSQAYKWEYNPQRNGRLTLSLHWWRQYGRSGPFRRVRGTDRYAMILHPADLPFGESSTPHVHALIPSTVTPYGHDTRCLCSLREVQFTWSMLEEVDSATAGS